jgi:metal-sulfur cluster biosynthetic enzyme
MRKENANPIIYQVTSTNDLDSESNAASEILKRLNHHDQQEKEGAGPDYYDYYDSLYHLDPHQYLTPVERSLKSALASIDEWSFRKHKNDKGPLDIFQVAGVKTLKIPPTNSFSSQSCAPLGMYFFKPSDAAIASQPYQTQQPHDWDVITQREVFDMIRNIQDPEHPLTLEQLNVVNCSHITVTDNYAKDESLHSFVDVKFTPTIPHCSMATLIGLCIRVKLLRSLPKRFKVTVRINPGTHASEVSINRQLNDKERVIAAMENVHLLSVVNKCIAKGMQSDE